ncbi:MAG: radical SAM family heme chaperone HemW [Ferruginibacter sp.]|nr:radical SAM family heme chaperone HemW [Ferruginibacter sp.]
MPGIYIHIPFCKQACHYCNFHFSTSMGQKEKMINAICKEISLYAPHQHKETIATLYFGGGTPSILHEDELKKIFDSLHQQFSFADDIEITLEANPDDITDKKLQQWKLLGINRLSVGIQSFLDEELLWMNRVHTAAESLVCIDKIQAAGFTNFSVDLIYGSPILNDDNWKKNVAMVIEKNIPHVSCYALTVEPRTALRTMIAQQKKQDVDTEKQSRQFLMLMNWMKAAGYEHYEISNFAKPGYRSRHNSSYWTGDSYYAFGPAAHGFDGKKRWWNIANNSLYIQSLQNNIIPFEQETLTKTQQLNEYIMTMLRTIEGLDLNYIVHHFGEEKSFILKDTSRKYESTGMLKINNNLIVLTDKGKLFADGIAAALFF